MKIRGNSTTSHILPRGTKSYKKNLRDALAKRPTGRRQWQVPISGSGGGINDNSRRASEKHGKLALFYDGKFYYVVSQNQGVVGIARTRRRALRRSIIGYR